MDLKELAQLSMNPEFVGAAKDVWDYYFLLVGQIAQRPELSGLVGAGLAIIDELWGAFEGEQTAFTLGGDVGLWDRTKRFLGVTIRESLPLYIGANLVDGSVGDPDFKGWVDYGLGNAFLLFGILPDKGVKPVARSIAGAFSFIMTNVVDSVAGSRRAN
jgi:hypothetical protein